MQKFQGDVGIVKLEKADKELTFKKVDSGFVVREGEISGHHHRLVADRETTLEIAQDEHGYFLKVSGGEAKLTHNDHPAQTIEQGLYFVPLQVEYDEVAERRVLD